MPFDSVLKAHTASVHGGDIVLPRIRAMRGWLGLAATLAFVSVGCNKSAPIPAKTGDKDANVVQASAAQPNAESTKNPDGEKPTDPKPADTTPAVQTPADETLAEAATTPVAAPPAQIDTSRTTAATASQKVLLGSPDLTAGIPGEGKLTVDQIRVWLDNPKNHETLDVELPLGLSLGALQMVGLKENPLTRAKIELGRQLYFDGRLSKDGTISCASCHSPDHGYAADTQFGVGVNGQTGNRNSPVAYNRILSGPQFWDGRAGSLEDQAIGPIQNPIEMANTHDSCVACIAGIEGYRIQFEKVFGGEKPVNIANVGKAIASFERALVTGPSPYDYYEALQKYLKLDPADLETLEEDDAAKFAEYKMLTEAVKKSPMSKSAIRGKTLYFSDKSRCATCHVGANFTDEKYHNLGVGMAAEKPDLGRYEQTKEDKDRGAFKTPTVRNVALTAPYMHDGSQKTLEEVVEWYAKGGHPNPHLSDKIVKLDVTEQDKKDLVEFMKALTGPLPVVNKGRLPE